MKNYSNAVKRSIQACKKRKMPPKEAADYINALKCVTKTGNTVTPQAITWAYKRSDIS